MSWWPESPARTPLRDGAFTSRDGKLVILALFAYAFLYLSRIDAHVYFYLKVHKVAPLRSLSDFISFLGAGETLLLFIFLFLALPMEIPRRKEVFTRSLLGLVTVGIVTSAIKILLGRPRPFLFSSGHYWPHGPTLMNGFFSTPSGHTTATFALAFIFSRYFPKAKYPLLFWALMVAVSRVILFYHYPSDVLISMVIGYVIGKWAYQVKLPQKIEKYLET